MKSFSLPLLTYSLPFTYFWKSRLKGLKDWVFHGWNEWIINLLILFLASNFAIYSSIIKFVIGYLGFISFYEIGYIFNDFYAVKKEANPRLRFGKYVVPSLVLITWILIRIAIFTYFLSYFNFNLNIVFFYCGLGLVFVLHNVLISKALKTFTFLQLALFRFWAPVFFFIPKDLVATLLPIVFFYYAFNRTLTYMDSKNLLQLPERTSISFRLNSSLILLVFTMFWSYFVSSWLCLIVSLYFLSFWLLMKAANRLMPI